MACPFLASFFSLFCTAVRSRYVPSDFEFEEYCRNRRYSLCPFYCGRIGVEYPVMRGKKHSQKRRKGRQEPVVKRSVSIIPS